jgi:hypothetical protein
VRPSHWLRIIGMVTLLASCPFRTGAAPNQIAGNYQCAAFHAGKIFLPCDKMQLHLTTNGTYQLAGESGSYRVAGNSVFLSKSGNSRRARLLGRDEIVFEYFYHGSKHTVFFKRAALPRGWRIC